MLSLQAWTAVLSMYATAPDTTLFPLVYPLCQVLIGVAGVVTSVRAIPFRFTVCSLLNEVRPPATRVCTLVSPRAR